MKVFPKSELEMSSKWKYGLLVLVVIVSALTLSPFVFSGVKIVQGSAPQPTPAPGIAAFAMVALSFVIGGIYLIIKRIRMSSDKDKKQFRLLLYGVASMFTLIIVFNFIFVAILGNSSFIPYSGIFILPFVIFTFYAIVKHELLNIRIVGTEILTFLLVSLAFMEVIMSRSVEEVVFRIAVFVALLIIGILFVRSVIKEVNQREQLEQLTQKLRAIDQQKDEFISMAAHELRAPMTAIKGYLSMVMEGDTGDIPEKARGFLADANSINDRLVRLVNNMLNVSRIEEGRMVYQVEVENLSSVARSVFAQFTPEAERKGLKYTLNIPSSIKDRVQVDPDRIHEVVANLISNAVKYTDEGSVKVILKQPDEGTVRCEIKDTGIGISSKEQKKLFQKFHRVESNVGKTTGTGLGLYICKLLVTKFNGKIGVNSKPGKGSTFWFELPLVS